MLDLLPREHALGGRIFQPDAAFKRPLQGHVDMLPQRQRQDVAPIVPVVGREVGAAAAERDAERAACDDHRSMIQPLSRIHRTVWRTDSSIERVGAQPSERNLLQSSWISGLSPTQPLLPPE